MPDALVSTLMLVPSAASTAAWVAAADSFTAVASGLLPSAGMAWTVVTRVVAAVVIVAAWPDRLAATSVPPVATAEAMPPTESFNAAVSSQTSPAHAVRLGARGT